MVKQFLILLLVAASAISSYSVNPQKSVDDPAAKGVPDPYAGNWICQTAVPGYNILPPHADPSQPATNKMSTPPTTVVVKFSLKTDGTYTAQNSKGHYSFDSATKQIAWLDGPHQKTFSKTQIGKRDNGAPKLGFVMGKRYYGCYLKKT
jgi:hypothetical protein